jgi:hypothetical protein
MKKEPVSLNKKYHARSHAENAFSAIKRRFGHRLASIRNDSQWKELSVKFIAYDLSGRYFLISSICIPQQHLTAQIPDEGLSLGARQFLWSPFLQFSHIMLLHLLFFFSVLKQVKD